MALKLDTRDAGTGPTSLRQQRDVKRYGSDKQPHKPEIPYETQIHSSPFQFLESLGMAMRGPEIGYRRMNSSSCSSVRSWLVPCTSIISKRVPSGHGARLHVDFSRLSGLPIVLTITRM